MGSPCTLDDAREKTLDHEIREKSRKPRIKTTFKPFTFVIIVIQLLSLYRGVEKNKNQPTN